MDNFFNYYCHRCSVTDEAKFVISGPHVKQVCNNCGFYVKFFSKDLIPSLKDIKLKIFNLCNGDLDIINKAKQEIGFPEEEKNKGLITGWNLIVLYWDLYLQTRKIIKDGIHNSKV